MHMKNVMRITFQEQINIIIVLDPFLITFVNIQFVVSVSTIQYYAGINLGTIRYLYTGCVPTTYSML